MNTKTVAAGDVKTGQYNEREFVITNIAELLTAYIPETDLRSSLEDRKSDLLEELPWITDELLQEIFEEAKTRWKSSDEIKVSAMRSFKREDDPNSLIGARWLCRGKQYLLQGPTGVGKSSLIMQWSICLVLFRSFFDIQATGPLKVMIIQAENDDGDMAEAFQDITESFNRVAESRPDDLKPVTEDDFATLEDNLIIVNRNDKTGKEFAAYLNEKIERHHPDIVFADPLLAYIGGNIMEQKEVSQFMRHDVDQILSRHGVALFWIHHISKPGEGKKGDKSSGSGKYSGLGSSEIQNVCREVITMSEVKAGLRFSLEFTKRGSRIGLKESDGTPKRSINLEHSNDGICWVKSQGAYANATQRTEEALDDRDKVWNYIENQTAAVGGVTLVQLKAWSKTVGINENRVGTIAEGIAKLAPIGRPEGRLGVIEEFRTPTGKGGKPGKFYRSDNSERIEF